MKISPFSSAFAAVSATIGLLYSSATVQVFAQEAGSNTIVDVIVADPELTTLVNLVLERAPFIVNVLSGPGPFTLFAPINSAFEGVNVQPGLLTTVLLYHAASGQVLSTDITDGLQVQTLQLENITFSFDDDDIFINTLGSQVVQPDILASNGVVHKISGSPLVPRVVLNSIQSQADQSVPAPAPTPAQIPPTPVPAPISNSVIDVAVELVSQQQPFDTLVNLVTLAGLATSLSESPRVTVLAPIDDAFAALPTDIVQALLTEPYTLHLQEILLYHVTPTLSLSTNLLMSSSVMSPGGLFLTSMNKAEDRIQWKSTDGVTLTVNDATVIAADVAASNGLIHGIDAVLLPPFVSKTVVDVVVGTPALDTLQALVIQAGLAETLAGAGPFTVFAPTNSAFLADVGANPQLDVAALTNILTYHVVAGMYPSTEITDGLTLTTVQGGTIEFAVDDETGVVSIVIPTAEGTDRSVPILVSRPPNPSDHIWELCQSTAPPTLCAASDLLAINGVVHQIGGVLVPVAPVEMPEVMAATP